MVLLGELGGGKSTVVKEKYPLVEPSCPAVRFDLAAYGAEERLVREVLECEAITNWAAGSGHLCLVLDSLDEAKLRVPQISAVLSERIASWPCDRLFLRIACRTADWPETLEQALNQAFGSSTVVEILPLRRADVSMIASEWCEPDAFLAAVRRAVRPGSRSFGPEFDPDITAMPRWATLSDRERNRFIEAAATYLRTGECLPDEWLG